MSTKIPNTIPTIDRPARGYARTAKIVLRDQLAEFRWDEARGHFTDGKTTIEFTPGKGWWWNVGIL